MKPARWSGVLAVLLLLVLATGCAADRRIAWPSRIGTYTYDDAVKEFGPPAGRETTSDGVQVVDWLTQKGMVYSTPSPGWSAGWWGRWNWGGAVDINSTPDQYLRLQFGPDGKLQTWKRVYK